MNEQEVFINKLTPAEIAHYWDAIKFGILNSVQPTIATDSETFNHILKELLNGSAQVWVGSGFDKETGGRTFYTLAVTYISVDAISGTRNLVLYALYGFKTPPRDLWIRGVEAFKEFAKANNCNSLVGYTNNPMVLELSHLLHFNHEYTVTVLKI